MYLVTVCPSCCRVALTLTKEAASCVCVGCAARTRVVPSCGYASPDQELFAELSEIVAEGGVSPLEAGRISFQVDRALETDSFELVLDTLSSRLPALTPIQLLVARNRGAQRRALRMVRTILDALATAVHAAAGPRRAVAPATVVAMKQPA